MNWFFVFTNYFILILIFILYFCFIICYLVLCNNFYLFKNAEYSFILPIGVLLVFLVSSTDIIHSFGILSLGIKIDAISGRINLVYELVKLNGKIKGFCYELCGQYHFNMVILGLCLWLFFGICLNIFLFLYFNNLLFML